MSIVPVSGGTFIGATSVSSVTISSLAMPVGRVLICIGATRDEVDRALSSVAHSALSNIVTQGNMRAFNTATSRSAEAWLVTADSSGGTDDLVITWDGTEWSQAVRVFDITAVGDLLTIGWTTHETSAASFNVTASDASAVYGLVFSKVRISDSTATVDVAPWSTNKLEQGGGRLYRAISATADSTTGATQTVSVSAGNVTVDVAAELLFAAPSRASMMMAA